MTKKQKIFADEYLIDLNATRAYRVAYPSVKKDETAAAAGARMLRNVKVQGYISERMQERQQRTEVTQDMVVKELAAIAFARATDYAAVRGGTVCIKDTDSLSDEQIRAIAGIKEGANGIEIKLNDKEKALELLGRHLGMWNDKCFLASNFPHFHRYDSLKSALYIHAVSKNINTFPKNQGRIRAAIAVKILDFTVMYR